MHYMVHPVLFRYIENAVSSVIEGQLGDYRPSGTASVRHRLLGLLLGYYRKKRFPGGLIVSLDFIVAARNEKKNPNTGNQMDKMIVKYKSQVLQLLDRCRW